MSILQLIVGMAALLVGGYSFLRRKQTVARLSARHSPRNVQSPIAYAVMGVVLGLAGSVLILSAIL